MMLKKTLLVILMLFSIMGVASAITFTDDFEGYGNYWKLIGDTDTINGYYIEGANPSDTNNWRLDTNQVKFGKAGVKVNALNSLFGIDYSEIYYPVVHQDLTDWNANARLYYWVKLDGNFSQVRQFSTRLGLDTGNYWAYYNTDGFPWSPDTAYRGYNLQWFDLNAAGGAGGGGLQNWSDVNLGEIRMSYGYDNNAKDFNWTINQVWLEKGSGSTNGVWRPHVVTGRPVGWGKPTLNGSDTAYQIANNDKTSDLNLATVFLTPMSQPTIARSKDYNITAQMDINQVNQYMETKIIFDWNTVSQYNAVYLKKTSGTTAIVGTESYTGGVATRDANNITLDTTIYHTLKFVTDNNNVKIYIDGIKVGDRTLPNRFNGAFGVDSNGGQTLIDDVSVIMTLGGQPAVDSGSSVSASGQMLLARPEWNIIANLFLPIILFLLMLGLVYGGITTGSPKIVLLGVIMVYLIYTLLTALFFS